MKRTKAGGDEDWFPWDEEAENSERPKPGPAPAPRLTAWNPGGPTPPSAPLLEHVAEIPMPTLPPAVQEKSGEDPEPQDSVPRGSAPPTADEIAQVGDGDEAPLEPGTEPPRATAASAAPETPENATEVPANGPGALTDDAEVPASDAEVRGDQSDVLEDGAGAPEDDALIPENEARAEETSTGAPEEDAGAPETVSDVPAALLGVPGPWDAIVAPAEEIPKPARVPRTPPTAGVQAPTPADPSEPGHPTTARPPADPGSAAASRPATAPGPVTTPDLVIPGRPMPSPPATASDVPITGARPSIPGRPDQRGQPPAPGTPPAHPQALEHTLALPAPPRSPAPEHNPASAQVQASDHTMAFPAPERATAYPAPAPPPPGASHQPQAYLATPGFPQAPGDTPGTPPPPLPPTPHAPTPRPGSTGPSRRTTAALAAAGAAVLVAAGITLAFSQLGGSSNPPCTGKACDTQQKTTAAAPVGPKLRYRTVDRETGYFEGTIAIVNPGTRPMNAWTLTFTYPGADIHNVWEAVLQRRGQTVTIVNAMTAAPIAPGRSFEVQFGGAGRPAMPTGCRLNNAPCVFVR